MAKQHLLLVDSDTKSLRILEVTLRKAGYQVTCALTGQDAVQILETGLPDLIISETRLPETDGYDLLRQLKAKPEWQTIPFVFLSSETAVDAKMKGLELGADEFLTKPFVVQEVRARLQILLQKKERETFETTPEGTTHFSGRLTDMAVVDLIQTVEVSRKSGVIQVRSPQGKMAAIYFRGGKIIDATLGKLAGEQAIYRLLNWTDGAFDVEFKQIRRKDVIELSSQGLLMEGMRRVDEWARMAEQLPPLNGVYEVDYRELADRLAEIPDEINGILRLFDGRRTLLDVVDDSGFDDVEALNVLAKLYVEGLVYDVNAAANAGAAAVVPDLEQWLQDVTPTPASDDDGGEEEPAAAAEKVAPTASAATKQADAAPAPADAAVTQKEEEPVSPFEAAAAAPVEKPAVEKPVAVEKPAVEKPVAVEKPAVEKPVAVEKPAAPEKPAEVEATAAVDKEPPANAAITAELGAEEVTNMLAAAQANRAVSPVGATFPVVPALKPPTEDLASAADLARLMNSDIGGSIASASGGGSDETREVPKMQATTEQETKAATPAKDQYDDGPTPTGVKPRPVEPSTPEALATTGMQPAKLPTGAQAVVSPTGTQYIVNADGSRKEMSRAEAEGWGDDAAPEPRISLDAVPMPEIVDVDNTRMSEPRGPAPGSETQMYEYDDEFPQSRKGRYIGIALALALIGGGGYEFKQYRDHKAAAKVAVEGAAVDKAGDEKAADGKEVKGEAGAKPAEAEAPKVEAKTEKPKNAPKLSKAEMAKAAKAEALAKAEAAKAEKEAAKAAKAEGAKPKEEAAAPAGDASAELASARALYKKGQLKKAIPVLEKLTKEQPTNDQALVLLANCYLDKGSASHALETAHKAVSANPQNADGFLVVGAVQQQEGRIPEAKSAYESYLKLAPKGQYAGEIRSILSSMR